MAEKIFNLAEIGDTKVDLWLPVNVELNISDPMFNLLINTDQKCVKQEYHCNTAKLSSI